MESIWAPTVFRNQQPHPAQLRFESSRVRMVLKAFNLEDHLFDLINDFNRCWGAKRLTFESFHRFFPTFPYMMDAQSFYRATPAVNPRLRLGGLFTKFPENFIFERYTRLLTRYRELSKSNSRLLAELVPAESRDLPLAMAFPCDGVRGGLVIHNGDRPLTESLKLLFDYHDADMVPHRLWVEMFAPWLRSLARSGWTPDSPEPERRPSPKPAVRRGAWVRPWMVEVCGGVGRDFLVLARLLRYFRRNPTPCDRSRLRLLDGGLWVPIRRWGMAVGVGLSESQVKRAIASLKRKGLIEVRRQADGKARCVTYVRPNREGIRKAKAEQERKPPQRS